MRAAALIVLALLAAGCAPTYPATAPGAAVQAPASPEPLAPPILPTTTPAARSPIPQASKAAARDACGAYELQGLVGRPRTDIPVPIEPRRQRVACTTCPQTDDVDPTRLNFLFDAQTGRIRQIRCG